MTVLLLMVASLCLLCRLRWGVGVMVCWCRRRKKNVSRRTFGRWTGDGCGPPGEGQASTWNKETSYCFGLHVFVRYNSITLHYNYYTADNTPMLVILPYTEHRSDVSSTIITEITMSTIEGCEGKHNCVAKS